MIWWWRSRLDRQPHARLLVGEPRRVAFAAGQPGARTVGRIIVARF